MPLNGHKHYGPSVGQIVLYRLIDIMYGGSVTAQRSPRARSPGKMANVPSRLWWWSIMNRWTEEELAHGWHSASRLRRSLLAGHPMPQLPPQTIRLLPGEILHGDTQLRHEVWYGMDVSYTHSTTAFGGPVLFTAGLLVSAAGNARRR